MLEVGRFDLRARRRSVFWYSFGLVLYTVVVVALYPAFKDATDLDELLESSPTLAAAFGISGSLTSPEGWMDANLYANFFPLVLLLLTIGAGASLVAGEEESGRLELILALPVSRRRLVGEKMAVIALHALVVAFATFLAVLVGRAFDLDLGVAEVVTTTVGVWLLALLFGNVAMAIGAGTGRRGTAIGITSALAAAAYLLSSLAPVVDALEPWRVLSPFFWAVGDGQLTTGLGLDGAALLVALVALTAGIAVSAFDRHDVS